MGYLSSRVSEGSTHAGIALVLQALKSVFGAEWHSLLDALTVFFAGTAAAIPDGAGKDAVK